MFKYSLEFRQNAIELVKKIGITKACKELNVAHGTVRRWCHEMNVSTSAETDMEEPTTVDVDALLEKHAEEEPPPEPVSQEQMGAEDESPKGDNTISMAMALLVIENTHLREIIRNLRDTISGLTDHKLL